MKKAILAGLTLMVLGCSPSTMATKKVDSAMAAVESAKSAGAAKVPEAAPSLAAAESDVTRAQTALKDGDYDGAKSAASSAYDAAEEALKIAREKGGASTAQAAADGM